MLQILWEKVRLRAFWIMIVIHIGLAVGAAGIAELLSQNGFNSATALVLIGFLFLYGGFLLAFFFVIYPVLPWIRRIRKIAQWREWILEDLPEILAMIPVIVEACKKAYSAWKDMSGSIPGLKASAAGFAEENDADDKNGAETDEPS